MKKTIQTAQIEWNSCGMPVATQFDDVYFSNHDGLAETRYVFLNQNHLPQRWLTHTDECFVIAESGFGSGLNFLTSWHAFEAYREQHPTLPCKTLKFISFEKYPMDQDDIKRTLAHWPELNPYARQLIQAYPQSHQPGLHRLVFEQGSVELELWFGDILDSLEVIACPNEGFVDAWFLDGFAPGKNPDMWCQPLFDYMLKSGRDEATFATFTAAGFVRRGLQSAGFDVKKVKGYGTKREMLTGCKSAKSKK